MEGIYDVFAECELLASKYPQRPLFQPIPRPSTYLIVTMTYSSSSSPGRPRWWCRKASSLPSFAYFFPSISSICYWFASHCCIFASLSCLFWKRFSFHVMMYTRSCSDIFERLCLHHVYSIHLVISMLLSLFQIEEERFFGCLEMFSQWRWCSRFLHFVLHRN